MNDKDKKPGNPWTKSLLIWVGVLFALVLFVQMIDGGSRTAAGTPITYSEFVRQVNDGNVTLGHHRHRHRPQSGDRRQARQRRDFRTVAPGDANVSDKLIAKGVAVQVKAEEQSSIWLYMLYNSLPFLLMIGIASSSCGRCRRTPARARWASARAARGC